MIAAKPRGGALGHMSFFSLVDIICNKALRSKGLEVFVGPEKKRDLES